MICLCIAFAFFSIIALMIETGSGAEIPFVTKYILYRGDLEAIPAIPRIVGVYDSKSPYISGIAEYMNIDLRPLTKEGTLLLFSQSSVITNIFDEPTRSEIWVETENRAEKLPSLYAFPAFHFLGVAIIPHTSKKLFEIRKSPIYVE